MSSGVGTYSPVTMGRLAFHHWKAEIPTWRTSLKVGSNVYLARPGCGELRLEVLRTEPVALVRLRFPLDAYEAGPLTSPGAPPDAIRRAREELQNALPAVVSLMSEQVREWSRGDRQPQHLPPEGFATKLGSQSLTWWSDLIGDVVVTGKLSPSASFCALRNDVETLLWLAMHGEVA